MRMLSWDTQKLSWLAIGLLATMLSVTGCASHTKMHKTTTVTTTQPQDTQSTAGSSTTSNEVGEQTTTTEKETTTTTQESSGGVVGGAFHFVGKVLAFPFKVIGGLFEAVF